MDNNRANSCLEGVVQKQRLSRINRQTLLALNLACAALLLLFTGVDFFTNVHTLLNLDEPDFMLRISIFYGVILYFGASCITWLVLTPEKE